MIPYIIVFIISLYGAYLLQKGPYNSIKTLVLLSIIFFPPTLLAGYRDLNIGTDIAVYVEPSFNLALTHPNWSSFYNDSSLEFIYTGLTYITSQISSEISSMLLVIEGFIMFNILMALYRLRKELSIASGLFFFFFMCYNNSYNAMRQSMALSVCLLCFTFIYTKKYIPAIFSFIVACLTHNTAFIFAIPIILFIYIQKHNITTFTKSIKLYIIILPSIFLLFDTIILAFISAGVLSSKFLMYSTSLYHNTKGVLSSIELLFNMLLLIAAILIHKGKNNSNKSLSIYLILNQYTVLTVSLLSVLSIWAGRVALYFSFLSIILFPINFNLLQSQKRKLKFIIYAMLIFTWYYLYCVKGISETYPYHSKILNI